MDWIMLPAMIGLALKLAILVFASRGATKSKNFSAMVAVFAMQNVCELLILFQFHDGAASDWIMRSYYLTTVALTAVTCLYAGTVATSDSENRVPLFNVIIGYSVLVSALCLFTDQIVAGSRPLEYANTAIRGQQYWLFQVMGLSSVVYTLWVLVKGYLNANTHRVQVQCAYTLLAITPLLLCTIGVIALMAMGIKINALAVTPIATVLFLLITLKSENTHRLTDIRPYLPNSLERRAATQMTKALAQYSSEEISHKEWIDQMEKIGVQYKQKKCGSNMSQVAKSMGMKRTTLYSVLKRHNLSARK